MIGTYLDYRTTSDLTHTRMHPTDRSTYNKLREIFQDAELYISKEFGYVGYADQWPNGTAQPASVVLSDPHKVRNHLDRYHSSVRTLIFDGSKYDANETAAISKMIDDIDFDQLTSFGWKGVKHPAIERWTKPKASILFATFAETDGTPIPMDISATMPNLVELNVYLRDRQTLQALLRAFRNMLNFGFFVTAQMLSFAAGAFAVYLWLNPQVEAVRTNLAFQRDFVAHLIPLPDLSNLKELTLKEYSDAQTYADNQFVRFERVWRFEVEINMRQALMSTMRLPLIFEHLEELSVTFHPEYSAKYDTNIPSEWLAPLLQSARLKRVALSDTELGLDLMDQLMNVTSIRQLSAAYPGLEQINEVAHRISRSTQIDRIVFYNVDAAEPFGAHFRTEEWNISHDNDVYTIYRIESHEADF